VTSFQNKWSKPQTPGISEKINETIKPKGPLKPRMEVAIKKIRIQIAKLDKLISSLKKNDEQTFQKIVTATQQHDTHATKVLAGELVEIRKVSKMLGSARMALEQIELRLTTFHDLGDTVITIMPTIGLMKSLKSSLVKFMPQADQELGQMAEMLGGLMTDSFQGSASFDVDATTNAESDKILQEAAAVAETAVNANFPTVPVEQGSQEARRYI